MQYYHWQALALFIGVLTVAGLLAWLGIDKEDDEDES